MFSLRSTGQLCSRTSAIQGFPCHDVPPKNLRSFCQLQGPGKKVERKFLMTSSSVYMKSASASRNAITPDVYLCFSSCAIGYGYKALRITIKNFRFN